ncbi:MAG TPA: M48 family metallopeptidase, partial [Rhodospirillaceae bacterium]|nr:M48 family metallopeptidase [Rhodospirillaceae bacterium]
AVTPADHAKAADYTVATMRAKIAGSLIDLPIMLGWLYFGIGAIQRGVDALVPGPVLSGSVLLVAIMAISAVCELPMSAYRTFVIEARFGFNKMSAKLFLLDWLKSKALSLAIAFVLVSALLWVMAHVAGAWWLEAWGGCMIFVASMMVAYPLLIAPLFNKFTPLADGEVKARVEALLAKAGFVASGLFVMDGSKRSTHGNAYFTGFGKAKRIVFYDTLLERLSVSEIEAVLAHELGHFKHRDILLSFARMAVFSLAVFWWLGVAAKAPWLSAGLGLPQSDAVGLVVAMICLSPVGVLLAPLGNWLSNRAESRADRFAAAMTGGGEALSSALLKLSRDNASTLTPDPVYVLFRYSHPPVPIRIERLRHAA